MSKANCSLSTHIESGRFPTILTQECVTWLNTYIIIKGNSNSKYEWPSHHPFSIYNFPSTMLWDCLWKHKKSKIWWLREGLVGHLLTAHGAECLAHDTPSWGLGAWLSAGCARCRVPGAPSWGHAGINVLFAFSDGCKGILGFLRPT
jgi:hypothetical protein